jgi:tripartite-type tricarboxylate transporter receptor subunit TctC
MHRRELLCGLIAATVSSAGLSPTAWAQAFPNRPIKLLVPFPAGGPADLFGRHLANGMAAELGQQVVIENRTGTGGLAGVDAVAKSAPDGYTIGINGSASLAIIPFMTAKMPFDWQKDLALLSVVVLVPEVLTVHPSLGVNTLQELVAHARANPGKVSYGSAGTGTVTHMAAELLRIEAKINIQHVPYRGAAPAVNDLLGNHVQMIVADVPVLLPHVKAGKIKALAITSATRTSVLPEVPTSAEAGYPSVLSDNWYGLVAPAGIPADILDKLQKAAVKTIGSAEFKRQVESQNATPAPMTPAEYAAFIKAEQAKWGPVVAATGAKLE